MTNEAIRAPVDADPAPEEVRTRPRLRPVDASAGGPPDTAGDMSRLARWATATFRPPDFWATQPSAKEELAYAKAVPYAPKGVSRALGRAYGYGAAGLIVALLAGIWVLRSPARTSVALLLAAVTAVAICLS